VRRLEPFTFPKIKAPQNSVEPEAPQLGGAGAPAQTVRLRLIAVLAFNWLSKANSSRSSISPEGSCRTFNRAIERVLVFD
jgi:hypothetical protein